MTQNLDVSVFADKSKDGEREVSIDKGSFQSH